MNLKLLSDQLPKNQEEVIKTLLLNRGIKTAKERSEFLEPKNPKELKADDLGIDNKEVDKALARIKKAIDAHQGIIVYGDYDADGICATAILWECLYKLSKNVLPYIPQRSTEGYGLNSDSIAELKQKNPNLGLIITVDHGITAGEKIKQAQKLGIDFIVCDHHQPGEKLPVCSAVVHTDLICAGAISWFLAKEIQVFFNQKETEFLDLVAIASIADLEPLVGINRSFVKYGLAVLRKTTRPGLLALFEEAGISQETLDTYEVGYILAPRLNAMGRLEHAIDSLRLLCTYNQDQAKALAAQLGLTNKERQRITQETLNQARLMVAGIEGELPRFLVIDGDNYEEGVIGLVAGKLVEEFYRPVLVISRGSVYSKASGRSISGFNLIEAIRLHSDLLLEAGGHPMAAGLTVKTDQIEVLKQRLQDQARKEITNEMLQKTLKIDLTLPSDLISFSLDEEIKKLSPFGIGNPQPIFGGQARVKSFRPVGSEAQHLKLEVVLESAKEKKVFAAIAFGMGSLAGQLKIDQQVQIAYNLSLNQWNNQKNIELKIKDLV